MLLLPVTLRLYSAVDGQFRLESTGCVLATPMIEGCAGAHSPAVLWSGPGL